jgi:N-acetyl sugar amidotransferase
MAGRNISDLPIVKTSCESHCRTVGHSDKINFKICSKCVLDSSVPDIRFDSNGNCNFCKMHDDLNMQYPLGEAGKQRLSKLIKKIKFDGQNKEYDCIVGVSGGRDSTFTLYKAIELGLRPLAVHFDNGWNSEIAVSNIKNATNKLNVDLHTVVADWEEFKDLQISFLKASVSDAEVPTDYAILSTLYDVSDKIGSKYILNGHSFRTEGVAPLGWTYMDGRYIKSVQEEFGNKKITSFPILSLYQLLYYTFIKGIKFIHLPEYMEYDQKEVGEVLESNLGWRYYGGHHHESTYTYFFQTYLLPRKFNIDKRKLEYSALIRSGQMTRSTAIAELQKPYPYDEEVLNYTISKLGLTQEEFNQIMLSAPKSFRDYPTYYPIIKALKAPIKIACTFKILPPVFYEKFLS